MPRNYKPRPGSSTDTRKQSASSATKARREAAQAAARIVVRQLKADGVMERKFKDDFLTTTALVPTVAGSEVDPPSGLCLNDVDQGDDIDQCIGRKYTIEALQVRGWVEDASLTAGNSRLVRLIIYQDKQTNNAQAQAEEVLIPTALTSQYWSAYPNTTEKARFKILMDRTITLTYDSPRYAFNWYKKLNIPVNNSGTTGGAAGINDNSLHMIAIAEELGPNIQYRSRLTFTG